jgi:predicted Fe-Mo cluster-binding NifX family protein
MKIAISSKGPDIKAAIDPRFGRAACFLLYDTEKKEVVEVIDNIEGLDASQGAGIAVAGLMASKGVEVIITGRVGPKAMVVIDKAGIKVVTDATGSVEEALHSFMAGSKDSSSAAQGRPGRCSTTRGQGFGGRARMGKGQGGRGMGPNPGR